MNSVVFPLDPKTLELLARIIDRARKDIGAPTTVSRDRLSRDLARLYRDGFGTGEAADHDQKKAWDMIAEEHPAPTRRYKLFDEALAADDPLGTLRVLSQDRSASEFYLLGTRIKTFGRSRRPTIENGLPDLKTAMWGDLSEDQQATIRKHMFHLKTFYYSTQKRNTDPVENRINLAVHDLAELFAGHTHFKGMPSDLPYAATSRFIQFLCLALRPIANPNKLSPDAVSMRWRRLKGPSDSHQD